MDLRKIKKLIELVEESGIAELEVKSGEETVRISMFGAAAQAISLPVSGATPLAAGAPATDLQALGADAPEATASTPVAQAPAPVGREIRSPLSGTFYIASAPGAQPYVQPGQSVAVGAVLCIVESMKMMNHIEAEIAGTVTAVLVDNGEPVEAGQPLFLLD